MVHRAVVGAVKLGARYWWIAPVLLGFLPAILLSNVLLGWVLAADWSCSRVAFGASGSRYGGCSIIAGELIVVVAVAWAAPLLVLVSLLRLSRSAHRVDGYGVRQRAAQSSGNGMDRTALFVRAVAVLVGLANMLVIGDPVDVSGFTGGQSAASALGNGFTAALAGLVASEIVRRRGRPAMNGGFLARYGITVLGACLGGAVLGAASLVLPGLSNFQPGAQAGPEGGLLFMAYALLTYGLFAAAVGGALGALEGLILGLPLAAILGKLGHTSQDRRRAPLLPTTILAGLMAVAAMASYAAVPQPEMETASLEDLEPLSCPGYLGEEVASIDGPGDRIIPAFETEGNTWGYQHASAGPGSLSVRVLDGQGKEVMPPEASLDTTEGSGGGSAEFFSSGTFSLEIMPDEGLKYRILVCD